MKAAITEILDELWCETMGPEFPIDPTPSFDAHTVIRTGVEDVVIFPSAYLRTIVENLNR